MKDKSIAFARVARDAGVALVYYSGHAMQFADSITSCRSTLRCVTRQTCGD
jgi:hypothetical protein